MLSPPSGIDAEQLLRVVDRQYDGAGDELVFVPLGEDSWSFETGQLWVSLRRDIQGHVPEAYAAALELRSSGLTHVLAPLPGRDGQVVRTVAGHPLVVYPRVDARQVDDGPPLSAEERREVVALQAALHRAVAETPLPTEDFSLPFSERLAQARDRLASLDAPESISTRAACLAARHAPQIDAWRAEIAELAQSCATETEPFVLSHGDPSGANILRGTEGLVLADWGALKWAPPERDAFHIERTLGLVATGRPRFLRFYELRWVLSEIAEYFEVFSHPHDRTPDDGAMWSRLVHYLPERSLATAVSDDRRSPEVVDYGRRCSAGSGGGTAMAATPEHEVADDG